MFQGIAYLTAFLLSVLVCRTVRTRSVRQSILLVASYALYLTWSYWFIVVLLISTAINFAMGKRLRKTPTPGSLAVGICLNLALLSVFKYLPEASIHMPFRSLQSFSHLALPLGISFWTFQAMSYLFDLYREEEMDPTFVEFALYMAFFPVTISGPICRLPDMLPQFRSEQPTPWTNIIDGFRRIGIGVLMMLLARLLGQGILGGDGIDSGFDRATHWSGHDVWCLAVGYGLQLFLDFAGYSHIAIGAAKALGLTVPENFDRPFASANPSDLLDPLAHVILVLDSRLRLHSLWRPCAENHGGEASFSSSPWFSSECGIGRVCFSFSGVHITACFCSCIARHSKCNAKFGWEPENWMWRTASWIVSSSLVSLGWILFRSSSVSQAGQMVSAALSPTSLYRALSQSNVCTRSSPRSPQAMRLLCCVVDCDRSTIRIRSNPVPQRESIRRACWPAGDGTGFPRFTYLQLFFC